MILVESFTPSAASRRRVFQRGGLIVNFDTNWGPPSRDGRTDPLMVIPDQATSTQRKLCKEYVDEIAAVFRERLGRPVTARVRTRSQNKRGRAYTAHTEPFAVTDAEAVRFFSSPEGLKVHADIVRRTLAKIPKVQLSLPHNPSRGDYGAHGNGTNEVALARLLFAELRKDADT